MLAFSVNLSYVLPAQGDDVDMHRGSKQPRTGRPDEEAYAIVPFKEPSESRPAPLRWRSG